VAHRVPARLTPAEGRRFGLTLGIAFGVLAALVRWRGGETVSLGLGAVALALLAGAALAPGALGPVHRGWMAFAERLSRVTTPIVMGVLYFLVITPMGLVMRLVGHRPLDHRSPRDSFWVERAAGQRRSALDRPY
jgi:hypothetical protein